jgi:3-keto-5-aminohexanoate cleavage enzyme
MRRAPVIIEVRANEYTSRARNPHVPFSPQELAADAVACREAGAAIFHYHARDPETGAASTAVELYADTCRRIKAATDLVVMPTLGAGTLPTPEERTGHVTAMAADPATRPDLAPIDCNSINIDPYDPVERRFANEDMVYLNPVRTLRRLAELVTGAGVKPMLALWNVGAARVLGAFCDMGLVAEPVYAQATLSDTLLSAHPATTAGLRAIVDFLPPGRSVEWSVLTFGSNALSLLGFAVEAGGHVALGLGDHPYPELGPAPTNADVVRAAVAVVRALGAEPATPAQARELLGLR